MASREFADYVIDALRALGPVIARRMFGGYGLYLEGCMFALIVDDTLYFKADDRNRSLYEGRQMAPFTYVRQGREVQLGYYAVPAEALEDEADLISLARPALEAALGAASRRRKATA